MSTATSDLLEFYKYGLSSIEQSGVRRYGDRIDPIGYVVLFKLGYHKIFTLRAGDQRHSERLRHSYTPWKIAVLTSLSWLYDRSAVFRKRHLGGYRENDSSGNDEKHISFQST